MNILLVNTVLHNAQGKETVGGVEYHRMVKPHAVLRRMFPEFDLLMTNGLNPETAEAELKQTDLVMFSRQLAPFEYIEEVAEGLNKRNIPFGIDIDDYWHLPETHVSYESYKQFRTPEATELSLRLAHFVTCTTPYLAEQIKPFNENVYVIENGIDTEDPVWQLNKVKSDRLRFGFTQGNTHFEDIKTISKDVVKSFNDTGFFSKAQVCLTGFAAFHPVYETKTTELKYERMLTNDYKVIRHKLPEYYHSLRLFKNVEDTNVPYRRVWGKDVFEFASVYDSIDVSVVPLIENKFNSCKSELKMIEAAFKDCSVMVSHVKPYTILATDKNSFDLNKKSFFEWQRYLLNNPTAVEDSKAHLKEDCKKYDLKLLTPKRKELYERYKKS